MVEELVHRNGLVTLEEEGSWIQALVSEQRKNQVQLEWEESIRHRVEGTQSMCTHPRNLTLRVGVYFLTMYQMKVIQFRN